MALLAPLVLAAWFLWPLGSPAPAVGQILLALVKAYALFFLTSYLATLLSPVGSRPSTVAFHLALVCAFASVFSLCIGLGLALAPSLDLDWKGAGEFRAAALDGFWCAVAVALRLVAERREGTWFSPS